MVLGQWLLQFALVRPKVGQIVTLGATALASGFWIIFGTHDTWSLLGVVIGSGVLAFIALVSSLMRWLPGKVLE